MAGLYGLKPEDLTRRRCWAQAHSRGASISCAKELPGFRVGYVIDVAPQTGVRQTRLLARRVCDDQGRPRAAYPLSNDSIARGRDYYMPYRVLLPKQVDNLLVAGRHYSATSQAQKMSREIPPCMAMGEAAGVAAALALDAGVSVRNVDVRRCKRPCARKAPIRATRSAQRGHSAACRTHRCGEAA